ncbi:hypothetical protein [Streptomyces boninensis]|uniref:hypothetical protein n=1 Tax=Streptomyces boninensis TaxID=2039455 RepID=UPI003B20D94D
MDARALAQKRLTVVLLAALLPGVLMTAEAQAAEDQQPPPTPNPVDWLTDAIGKAIGAFFEKLVSSALNPLLDLLGHSLFATPTPDQLPRIGELWDSSWQIMLASYGILVAVGGVVVMAHESVQTRYSIKEIGPRVVLGFLASALSLPLAGQAIALANALSAAVLGGGVDEGTAAAALRNMVSGALVNNLFMALIGLVLVIMLLVLLVTYVVRVALTVIMVAGAPLALMCYALPQTEAVARWWWRVFGGLLAIQVAQALALITAIRLFLTPDTFQWFGVGNSGLVNLIVALGLVYILLRIPFWILQSVRVSRRRSMAGGVARAYVFGRVLHVLRGR